jgi:hypothetical protein
MRVTSQQSQQSTPYVTAVFTLGSCCFFRAARWINPLMGWTSTSDPLENVSRAALQFYTKVGTALSKRLLPHVRHLQ